MMWTKFTRRARRAVFFTQEEASRMGQNDVGPEHLLLGLMREQDTAASYVLRQIRIAPQEIRAAVEKASTPDDPRAGRDAQLKLEAKRAIDLAYDETLHLGQSVINTGHILLGILREGGIAAQVLQRNGVALDSARTALRKFDSEGNSEE
ncbi:MAG: hypothetical protein H7145_17670 [Akkermansiaceae bacterium]|nr:hypothetical protein [Armatimonadota bacterium]